ncbi:hypothetical protein TNCV_3267541 [Trichonephila clavipes]|nr:hypothetical protein TNCV_3267541 [Trichonephila clavipes]
MQTLLPTGDGIFLEDNTPLHAAGLVQSWFDEHEDEVKISTLVHTDLLGRIPPVHSHPVYSFWVNISTPEPHSPFGPGSFDPSLTALPVITISCSWGYSLYTLASKS